jgi:hypothetical protein
MSHFFEIKIEELIDNIDIEGTGRIYVNKVLINELFVEVLFLVSPIGLADWKCSVDFFSLFKDLLATKTFFA